LYAEAARRAQEIAIAIVNRSRELEEAGYHAQVAPSENSFPLFWHDDNGARHALIRNENGKYQAKSANQKPDRQGGLDGDREFTAEELAEWTLREPDRNSACRRAGFSVAHRRLLWWRGRDCLLCANRGGLSHP